MLITWTVEEFRYVKSVLFWCRQWRLRCLRVNSDMDSKNWKKLVLVLFASEPDYPVGLKEGLTKNQ